MAKKQKKIKLSIEDFFKWIEAYRNFYETGNEEHLKKFTEKIIQKYGKKTKEKTKEM